MGPYITPDPDWIGSAHLIKVLRFTIENKRTHREYVLPYRSTVLPLEASKQNAQYLAARAT